MNLLVCGGLKKYLDLDNSNDKSNMDYYIATNSLPDIGEIDLHTFYHGVTPTKLKMLLCAISPDGTFYSADLQYDLVFGIIDYCIDNTDAQLLIECLDALVEIIGAVIAHFDIKEHISGKFDDLCSGNITFEQANYLFIHWVADLEEHCYNFENIVLDAYKSNKEEADNTIFLVYNQCYIDNDDDSPWQDFFDAIIEKNDYKMLSRINIDTFPEYQPILDMLDNANIDAIITIMAKRQFS